MSCTSPHPLKGAAAHLGEDGLCIGDGELPEDGAQHQPEQHTGPGLSYTQLFPTPATSNENSTGKKPEKNGGGIIYYDHCPPTHRIKKCVEFSTSFEPQTDRWAGGAPWTPPCADHEAGQVVAGGGRLFQRQWAGVSLRTPNEGGGSLLAGAPQGGRGGGAGDQPGAGPRRYPQKYPQKAQQPAGLACVSAKVSI